MESIWRIEPFVCILLFHVSLLDTLVNLRLVFVTHIGLLLFKARQSIVGLRHISMKYREIYAHGL